MTGGLWLGVLAGLGIIAILGWIAARDLKKLKAQEAAKQEAAVARAKNLQVSIDAISRAVVSDQCDVSEGAMRLKPLMDAVDPAWADRSDLQPILHLAEALADQPIKDARKALPKQERMRFDLERMKLEAQHQDGVKAACAIIARGDS